MMRGSSFANRVVVNGVEGRMEIGNYAMLSGLPKVEMHHFRLRDSSDP